MQHKSTMEITLKDSLKSIVLGLLAALSIYVCILLQLPAWVTKLKFFNNLITYFLGMTAWFSYSSDSLNNLPMLMLSLGLGIGFGYVYTVFDGLISNYKYNGK